MIRNITLSAEELAIEMARASANQQNTTLNNLFREWLDNYNLRDAGAMSSVQEYRAIMQRLRYAQPGRKFTREELNAR